MPILSKYVPGEKGMDSFELTNIDKSRVYPAGHERMVER